jgi:RNA polymerase sigma-70 factor (ECF subfamily)
VRINLREINQESFKAIVHKYTPAIYSICFHILLNSEDAEDLTQDVFMQAYQARNSFRGEAQVKTWLNRIAVNLCLNYIRRKRRQKRFGQMKQIFGLKPKERLENTIIDNNDPHQVLEGNENRRLLDRAVAALPNRQRLALILHKYDGYSHAETAEILGLSISSVESLIHRAKNNLRKKLDGIVNK